MLAGKNKVLDILKVQSDTSEKVPSVLQIYQTVYILWLKYFNLGFSPQTKPVRLFPPLSPGML